MKRTVCWQNLDLKSHTRWQMIFGGLMVLPHYMYPIITNERLPLAAKVGNRDNSYVDQPCFSCALAERLSLKHWRACISQFGKKISQPAILATKNFSSRRKKSPQRMKFGGFDLIDLNPSQLPFSATQDVGGVSRQADCPKVQSNSQPEAKSSGQVAD